MKNKERLNLMLERLDRLNKILDEKLESSCKEGKSCRKEDIDDLEDLENMDEGILKAAGDAIKSLAGKSGEKLETQSKDLAKKITSYLGSPLKDLIQVTPRKENILRLQGMGCTIQAKNKDDDKYTVYIYTPKNKSSYIFISETKGNDKIGKKTHVEEVDLNKPAKIADYIKKNLSNFTNIKLNKLK